MRHLLCLLVVLGCSAGCRLSGVPADTARGSAGELAESLDSGGVLLPEQASYDVTYYDLSVNVSPQEESIQGSVLVRARVGSPLSRFVLDLHPAFDVVAVDDLTEAPQRALRFERRGGRLWIVLPVTRQPGDVVAVRVTYGGKPRVAPQPPWSGGFTWSRTPEGDPWIATTCQKEGADLWWPVKDHVSDEPDSMDIHVTVPDLLVVASNGQLRGVDENGNGSKTYHWHVSTPINVYNVALNIAPYETLEARYGGVTGEEFPVILYVLPGDREHGEELLAEILAHLRFYEGVLGPYPFRADKYGVAQTPHLGMEHQTIIAYGGRFDPGAMTAGKDWGFDALHHHELSHEWWGNLVTNADWKDMWIHEGFGTYMQALYLEDTQGIDRYHEYLGSLRRRIANRVPVAPREITSSGGVYGGDIYFKGAWVLHTLRFLVGEGVLRAALRRMAYPDPALERSTDGSACRFVTTADFVHIVSSIAGHDLGWFFEVYLRQPRLPRLLVDRGEGALELRWKVPDTLTFPMPVEVRLGDEVRRVEVPTRGARVEVPPGVEPAIDPQGWILRELETPD